jgi:hypothetical protein
MLHAPACPGCGWPARRDPGPAAPGVTLVVLNQPALPRAVWRATVEKMIHTYMAPVDKQDAAAIVDYLTRTKGVQ